MKVSRVRLKLISILQTIRPKKESLNEEIAQKRYLVKDAIWGSTPIMIWEKQIIEHPIFARLHNVLQNSSAYRVYPGLRTTRFSHSLGVMHVATKIFNSLLLHQEQEGVDRNGKEAVINTEIREAFRQEAEILSKTIDVAVHSHLVSSLRRVFPLRYHDGEEVIPSFYILHAMLRIAALMHDIGHLPYSHIFEFALLRVVEEKLVWKGDTEDFDDEQSAFKTLVTENEPGKLHEIFGKSLMSIIGDTMSLEADGNRTEGKSSVPYRLLIEGAINILHTEPNLYPITRSILSGVADADRIDFVRRDTQLSGLLVSSVDYERLFAFYQIQKAQLATSAQGPAKQYTYIATPGLRAMSDAEKLLWERFQDYKYIVCHHRVQLNDELLERCIIELSKLGELQSLFSSMLDIAESTLAKGHRFIPDRVKRIENVLSLLTEFDDAWLEIKFRELYRKLISSKSRKLNGKGAQTIMSYIEGTYSLRSAFHSDHDFWDYAQIHYRPLRDLRDRETNDSGDSLPSKEIKRRAALLAKISLRVNQDKHIWEENFFKDEGQLIIIGEVCHKLKKGFSTRGDVKYKSLQVLDNLDQFLSEKIAETMCFNFWFPQEGGEMLKEKIFTYIRDQILGVLELPKQR